IENTSDKLDILKETHQQAEKQLADGKLGQDEFDALTREIIKTENQLDSYNRQLQSSKDEMTKLKLATDDLQALFEVTEKSVDDFSDVLGDKLTSAIKDGRASSTQLEEAIEKIGKSALGTETDIDQLRQSLRSIDGAGGIDSVRNDLKKMESDVEDTED